MVHGAEHEDLTFLRRIPSTVLSNLPTASLTISILPMKLVFGFDVIIMDKAATSAKHRYGVAQEIKG